ncbi:hypothetical protein ABZ446_28580 [Streptomyces sp. NPDC005813]|uniref:hypothetical protein n=1 Tax=Streptomyces sp. NPDC005813 TaxID=3155592 RepID=UPI0033E207AE
MTVRSHARQESATAPAGVDEAEAARGAELPVFDNPVSAKLAEEGHAVVRVDLLDVRTPDLADRVREGFTRLDYS